MAIYHLAAQIIGRAAGRSVVAAAAYRSGNLLFDERTGTPHLHGNADRVAHTEIIAPVAAPAWAINREQLWNRVEAGERRKDSQLAREFEIALPNELSLHEQAALIRGWVKAELTPLGVIADVAIHIDPNDRAARQPGHTKAVKARNDHAHVMTTMRGVAADGDGFGAKLRELNWNGTLPRWRTSWAEHANAALERAGSEARIDHRSHAERGLEEEPTKKEGLAARQIEARGQESDRMTINRGIRAKNARLREVLERMKRRIFNSSGSRRDIDSIDTNIPLDIQSSWLERNFRGR